jgi:hypothetical protein
VSSLAAVSSTWVDLDAVAVLVTSIIGAAYAVHRAVRSVRAWGERTWDRAELLFSKAVDASSTGHIVKHHLGGNGTTTPMHVRMARLEAAHAIEDQPVDADSPWCTAASGRVPPPPSRDSPALGPNGTTTPMHERMRRLEHVHAIEDTTDPEVPQP